jgi:hypothetical protein
MFYFFLESNWKNMLQNSLKCIDFYRIILLDCYQNVLQCDLLTNCYVSDLSWKYYFWWNLKQKINCIHSNCRGNIWKHWLVFSDLCSHFLSCIELQSYNKRNRRQIGRQSILKEMCVKKTIFFDYLLSPLSPSFCLTPSSSRQFTLELPTLLIAPTNSLWNWHSLNSDQNLRELTLLRGGDRLKR